jgi:hypothetical protein
MLFNATFNNISAISWRSVLLVAATVENDRVTSPLSGFKLATLVIKVWYLVKWGLIKGRNSCLAYSELLFWLYLWQEQDYTCICKRWNWDGHGDGCSPLSGFKLATLVMISKIYEHCLYCCIALFNSFTRIHVNSKFQKRLPPPTTLTATIWLKYYWRRR